MDLVPEINDDDNAIQSYIMRYKRHLHASKAHDWAVLPIGSIVPVIEAPACV